MDGPANMITYHTDILRNIHTNYAVILLDDKSITDRIIGLLPTAFNGTVVIVAVRLTMLFTFLVAFHSVYTRGLCLDKKLTILGGIHRASL